jgi:hypothetical protein
LTTKNYMSLYIQLGRLLETAPSTTDHQAFASTAGLQWLGRGHALVTEVGVHAGMDAISYTQAMGSLKNGVYGNGLSDIFQILYRALAHCELRSPDLSTNHLAPRPTPLGHRNTGLVKLS